MSRRTYLFIHNPDFTPLVAGVICAGIEAGRSQSGRSFDSLPTDNYTSSPIGSAA